MSGDEDDYITGHELSVEELCKKLETNVETGLTDDQVKERQKKVEKIEGDEEVIMALARRNGCLVEIPATDLVVGDIVEVKLKGPLKGNISIFESSTLEMTNYDIIIQPARARAVTGRRCPHSGVGRDFLARNGPNRTKTGVTRQQNERFGWAQRLSEANAKGYTRPVDKNRGPI